ncbi:MAG: iduronate sulfatase [Blastopirellula sp.]|nr:MAG: iduronate sulfatase [Blastopirellula sp.]
MIRLSMMLLVLLTFVNTATAEETRPNVLFIAVDDLRPELGCYGKKHIHSPNIDKLASAGVLFEKAYCMVPTCGASRASMMTGIRPSRKRFVNYLAIAENDAPGITTMNTQFKNNGYYTVSLGKIFHNPSDNAAGWSEPAWRPKASSWYQRPENIKLHAENSKLPGKKRGPAWESADVADNAYADGLLAEHAISKLKLLKEKDQPFFMAVGFLKPHLPFIAPKKYWELYDHAKIKLPSNYRVPKNAPKESIHSSGELRAYSGIPAKGRVSDETALNLIHGYYACVSYTDAQIGKLLNELDRLELTENTIVVLWGDHGWNLGEHTLWCKHSCYETSMQIPLIIRAPNVQGGQTRSGLVESIDLYPTLCELTGIAQPEHLQGDSLASYLKDAKAPWKLAAIGRFQAGDTIRIADYRFTEYTDKKGKQTAKMLYKHDTDPDENRNVIQFRKFLTEELTKQLHQQMGRDAK